MSGATAAGSCPGVDAPIRRGRTVVAIGVTQIFAWGSSYYLPAVLASTVASDTGWPLELVVGGLSLGSGIAALVAPRVGRAIDRHGGQPVLLLSALLLAAGLSLIGLAWAEWVYLLAWAVMGLGMACGLYDAAFGTLGRLLGRDAKTAITTVTLFGGFASTVCWPLSAALVDALGWRGACFAYAGLQILLAVPLYRWIVPALPPARLPSALDPGPPLAEDPGLVAPERRKLLIGLVGLLFTTHSLIVAVISVHLLTLLQQMGLGLAAAVVLGTLIGPAQVGARLLQFGIARRLDPMWTALTAITLLAVGLTLLALFGPVAATVAILLYGAGNGLQTIAKGILPLALFGTRGYATLMGRLALPILLAQALGPLGVSRVISDWPAQHTMLVFSSLAAANVALVLMLWRLSARR